MQPTQARIVIAKGGAARSNGSETAPAIITRVWDQNLPMDYWNVNVTVFPDAAAPVVVTSARLYYDVEAADAAVKAMQETSAWHESMTVLYWPPRV